MNKKIHINLRVDKEFFLKMKKHKSEMEWENKKMYDWEEYIKILLGMAK